MRKPFLFLLLTKLKEAITKALADANVPYEEIEQVAVGYCYGDSTCGQRALYSVGMSGRLDLLLETPFAEWDVQVPTPCVKLILRW